MLMSRHGVTDGRPHAHVSWGGCLMTRWVRSVECPMGGVLLSPAIEVKTAFRDLRACTDETREVAV